MNPKTFLWVIGCAAFLAFGFTWPWDAPQNQQKQTPQNQTKTSSAPNTVAPSGGSSTKGLAAKKNGSGKELPAKAGQNEKGKPRDKSTASSGANIAQIQEQIQTMIKVNENLKARYGDQAAEIQKISEQAMIHQKILKDLQGATPSQLAYPSTDAQELLRQEKIRLIQEQTQRNQKIMDHLKNNQIRRS